MSSRYMWGPPEELSNYIYDHLPITHIYNWICHLCTFKTVVLEPQLAVAVWSCEGCQVGVATP